MTTTGTPTATGAWQATHVFYAANPAPAAALRPAPRRRTGGGRPPRRLLLHQLLARRAPRPADQAVHPAAEDEVRSRTARAVDAFLAERPALYEVDSGFLSDFYNTLFEIEFPAAERGRYTDDQGRMRLRPNNTCSPEPYEPEYGKYGGPAGIELAEWHFRHSSDLVIEAFRTKNLHLRTVLLGTSAQLMMVMSGTFLPDGRDLADYLDSYYAFWHRAFPGTDFIGSEEYDTHYAAMAPKLAARFAAVRTAVAGATTRPGCPRSSPAGPRTAPNSATAPASWPRTATWSSGPGTAPATNASPTPPPPCRASSPRTCT